MSPLHVQMRISVTAHVPHIGFYNQVVRLALFLATIEGEETQTKGKEMVLMEHNRVGAESYVNSQIPKEEIAMTGCKLRTARILPKAIAGVVITALLIMTVQLALWGQEETQVKPDTFFRQEVAMGTLGAALGLSLMAWVAYACPAGVIDFMVVTKICGQRPFSDVATAYFGGLAGIPLGASLGVLLAGSQNRVRGNIPLMIIFAYAADYAVVYTTSIFTFFGWLAGPAGKLIHSASWLVITALGATIGYNMGATMKSEAENRAVSAIRFSAPLFELKF